MCIRDRNQADDLLVRFNRNLHFVLKNAPYAPLSSPRIMKVGLRVIAEGQTVDILDLRSGTLIVRGYLKGNLI